MRYPHIRLSALCAALIVAISLIARGGPPADGVVVFNEIMFNPAGTGGAGEWVELHNQMGVRVDLSDWKIEGGIGFTFPDGTVIDGGASLVIAKTPGMFPGALGPFDGALANNGETLRLVDKNDRLLDELSYN